MKADKKKRKAQKKTTGPEQKNKSAKRSRKKEHWIIRIDDTGEFYFFGSITQVDQQKYELKRKYNKQGRVRLADPEEAKQKKSLRNFRKGESVKTFRKEPITLDLIMSKHLNTKFDPNEVDSARTKAARKISMNNKMQISKIKERDKSIAEAENSLRESNKRHTQNPTKYAKP